MAYKWSHHQYHPYHCRNINSRHIQTINSRQTKTIKILLPLVFVCCWIMFICYLLPMVMVYVVSLSGTAVIAKETIIKIQQIAKQSSKKAEKSRKLDINTAHAPNTLLLVESSAVIWANNEQSCPDCWTLRHGSGIGPRLIVVSIKFAWWGGRGTS